MTPPTLIEPRPVEHPPVVQSQLDHPLVQRRSWLTTIAPAYLGVLVWAPFLDPLGALGSGAEGVLGPFLNALLALVAGYLLLYDAPARLGWATGKRLPVVAAAALGAEGSEWIAGVMHGFFGLVWCAVSIYFSVKLILLGLLSSNLIDTAVLQRGSLGGLTLESPLFLVCTAFWTFIIASANGLRLVGVIAALMKVYAPVAACLLVLIAAWAWTHPLAPAEAASELKAPALFEPRIFQLVLGYLAFAGVTGVEWGAAVRRRQDVRIGGGLGILAAGTVTVGSALILGASDPGANDAPGVLAWDLPTGSFQGAVFRGLAATAGSKAAGVILLLFGLAALAPACYGSALFTSRFRAHSPRMQGRAGLWLGCLLVFVLSATALAARLETIFTLSGALFAPLAGVLTVESLLRRGEWTGVRPGWRLAGVAAWIAGCLVGLAPVLTDLTGIGPAAFLEPAALYAYLAAAIAYGSAGMIVQDEPTGKA